jgi:hypothetical protein
MSVHDVGRRPRTSLEETLELLPSLLEKMDGLVTQMSIEREQSSSAIAALRGKSNQMLYCGMVAPQPTGQGYALWTQDFTVPYATVAVADVHSIGNLQISNGAMGSEYGGVGMVIVTKGRFACFPLEGNHLAIQAFNPPGNLFVAVYVDKQPINFGTAT